MFIGFSIAHHRMGYDAEWLGNLVTFLNGIDFRVSDDCNLWNGERGHCWSYVHSRALPLPWFQNHARIGPFINVILKAVRRIAQESAPAPTPSLHPSGHIAHSPLFPSRDIVARLLAYRMKSASRQLETCKKVHILLCLRYLVAQKQLHTLQPLHLCHRRNMVFQRPLLRKQNLSRRIHHTRE